MYNKITAVEAKKIMDDHEKVTDLDVREPDELVEGYIENSKLIPLGEVYDFGGIIDWPFDKIM